MALKVNLNDDERYGLSQEEIKLATRWLRQNKTASVIPELEAAKLFELFLLGEPLAKLAHTFPQYPLGQIIFTAAYKQWGKDRDKMMHTLKDRVQAKVVKSILDQVDFLTTMMAVANSEHLESMVKYCQDPLNNPKPSLRITSIKDYKEIADTLAKIVTGATSGAGEGRKSSPMIGALTSHAEQRSLAAKAALPEEEKEPELTIMDVH
jgi:deoxyribodipyrimidine photolyase